MYKDGTLVNSGLADLGFKSRWGGASYNVVVAMELGESFANKKDEIRSRILSYETKGYSPISIQDNIIEATTAYINVTGIVFLSPTADFNVATTFAEETIFFYLDSLQPGENVIFSKIEQSIMNAPGIEKLISCTIQKNSETPITNAEEADILIGPDEIAVLGEPGTNFTEGQW